MKNYIKVINLGRSGYFIDTLDLNFDNCFAFVSNYITFDIVKSKRNFDIPTYTFCRAVLPTDFESVKDKENKLKHFNYDDIEKLIKHWEVSNKDGKYFLAESVNIIEDLKINYKKYIDQATIKNIIE